METIGVSELRISLSIELDQAMGAAVVIRHLVDDKSGNGGGMT